MNQQVPAQLFIGQETVLQSHTELLLQAIFCPRAASTSNQAECFCTTCKNIKQRQHQNMLWICPEGDYKVDDLEIIFEKAHLALDAGEHFYFILEKAETLNTAGANKLLKILEEPPVNYHFILLTSNDAMLLPTIRSRCVKEHIGGNVHDELHPFLQFFCSTLGTRDPLEFEQSLKQYHFSDTQSTQLAYDLLNYFAQKISTVHTQQQQNNLDGLKYYQNIIIFVQKSLRYPPQSGSSELFWKNLYLHFPFRS